MSFINEGKKSLEIMLREKAYKEVCDLLKEKGIAIEDVDEEELQAIIAERVKSMESGLKGFAAGGLAAIVVTSVLGF